QDDAARLDLTVTVEGSKVLGKAQERVRLHRESAHAGEPAHAENTFGRPIPATTGVSMSHTRARRAVIAVFATFVLNGFTFANWLARIPTIRDELNLAQSELGLIILIGSLGSILAMPLT